MKTLRFRQNLLEFASNPEPEPEPKIISFLMFCSPMDKLPPKALQPHEEWLCSPKRAPHPEALQPQENGAVLPQENSFPEALQHQGKLPPEALQLQEGRALQPQESSNCSGPFYVFDYRKCRRLCPSADQLH